MDEKTLKAMEERQDRKADELWVSVPPPAKLCRTCVYAFPNTKYTTGAEKANCEMFMPPDDKPQDVLWGDEECSYYEEKEEE